MILFGIYLAQAFLLAFAQRPGSGNDYLKKTEQGPWFTGQCNHNVLNDGVVSAIDVWPWIHFSPEWQNFSFFVILSDLTHCDSKNEQIRATMVGLIHVKISYHGDIRSHNLL